MNAKQLKEILSQNEIILKEENLQSLEGNQLSKLDIIDKIREINPNIPQSNATEFAGLIMEGNLSIQKEQFIQKMKKTFDEIQMDEIWVKTTMKRISIQLQKLGGVEYVQSQFEVGRLTTAKNERAKRARAMDI